MFEKHYQLSYDNVILCNVLNSFVFNTRLFKDNEPIIIYLGEFRNFIKPRFDTRIIHLSIENMNICTASDVVALRVTAAAPNVTSSKWYRAVIVTGVLWSWSVHRVLCTVHRVPCHARCVGHNGHGTHTLK